MKTSDSTNSSNMASVALKAATLLLAMTMAAGALLALQPATARADTATNFATRLYTAVLDRSPDSVGFATQVNALRSGQKPAEIAYNFFNSKEYFQKHETASETVERVYQVMFGRASDSSGKSFWVGYLNAGMSVRAVIQGFSQADEYKAYFGSTGLNATTISLYDGNADKAWDDKGNQIYAGGNSRDLNRGATEFAKRLYTLVLGRDAEVSGLNVQAGALVAGTPCWQIAQNFFNSSEFKAKGYTNSKAVSLCYQAILGRTGSSSEISTWVDDMESSCYTVADVVLHFCNSTEFNNLCAKYGLTSGMRGSNAAALPTPRPHSFTNNKCTRCGYTRTSTSLTAVSNIKVTCVDNGAWHNPPSTGITLTATWEGTKNADGYQVEWYQYTGTYRSMGTYTTTTWSYSITGSGTLANGKVIVKPYVKSSSGSLTYGPSITTYYTV